MTQQELIEQNVRMTLGTLNLQLIIAQARVTELEQQVMALNALAATKSPKPNGKSTVEERPANIA